MSKNNLSKEFPMRKFCIFHLFLLFGYGKLQENMEKDIFLEKIMT